MCLFCDIWARRANPINVEDTIIEESESFYVKAALGQFVQGYVLINTKKHYPNYASIRDERLFDELNRLINVVCEKLSQYSNNSFLIFEHGSLNTFCKSGSCIAKCIDHAHLHVIPTDVDIETELKNEFDWLRINSLHELSMIRHMPYIFYQSNGRKYVFFIKKHIQSQFVRKILCEKMSISNQWNWRTNPFAERIEEFLHEYDNVKILK